MSDNCCGTGAALTNKRFSIRIENKTIDVNTFCKYNKMHNFYGKITFITIFNILTDGAKLTNNKHFDNEIFMKFTSNDIHHTTQTSNFERHCLLNDIHIDFLYIIEQSFR